MTPASGQWDDLVARVASGGAIAAVGLVLMWAGGPWFLGLCALVVGVMIWELSRMLGAGPRAPLLGAVAGAAILAAGIAPAAVAFPILLAPGLAGLGFGGFRTDRVLFAGYATLIAVAAYGLMALRADSGFTWLAWLVAVVVASDIAGYFAGRTIGGPKFWPRVSPKKTWSGTIAGWIGAALVGAGFMAGTGAGAGIVPISVVVAMAGQMGDIAESAVKRHSGIKDSSNLIPGHGGLFDRFDALLGASAFLFALQQVVSFPPVPQ